MKRQIQANEELLEIGVFMGVGRRATTQETQCVTAGVGDLVPGSRRDENGIVGGDGFLFPIDFHQPLTAEDEVDFFSELVIVALRLPAGGQRGFGKGLILHRCVGFVQDAADGRSVRGGEGSLLVEVLNVHAGSREYKVWSIKGELRYFSLGRGVFQPIDR